MRGVLFLLGPYLLATVLIAGIQAIENRTSKRGDPWWTPVWWIALTWPIWIIVIALDIPWGPHRRKRR